MKIPDGISRKQLVEAIDEWIVGKNGERDRQIMKRRLIDGLTYDALAGEFDLSYTQIKTIVYKCEPKIFKHL